MNDHWTRILGLVLAHLPSDIEARRAALESLLAVMPPGHAATRPIRESLGHLSRHIIQQRELNLTASSESGSTATTRGGRRLGDSQPPR